VNLTHLGWSAFYARTFEPYAREGCAVARVAVAHGGRYTLLTAEGEAAATAAGRLLYRDPEPVVVGDWVALGAGGLIEAVLPRRTLLARKQPGASFGRQPLAANLDVLFIVTGLDGDFSVRRIERYLVLAEESGIAPVVVLSKADLLDAPGRERALAEVRALAPGAPAVLWSAFEPSGRDALDACVGGGQTAGLAGSSGVGKSTLVNCLLGYEALATQPVRESDDRGRHTTTRRQLLPLPRGWVLVDMPGLREVQLWAQEETVRGVFEDIEEAAVRCRFRDCTHAAEPGCAVRDAVDPARLAQYHSLRREAGRLDAAARKQRDRLRSRAAREVMKMKRRFEP
jgi:ribosome biogenesis GTPase